MGGDRSAIRGAGAGLAAWSCTPLAEAALRARGLDERLGLISQIGNLPSSLCPPRFALARSLDAGIIAETGAGLGDDPGVMNRPNTRPNADPTASTPVSLAGATPMLPDYPTTPFLSLKRRIRRRLRR